LSDSPFLRFTDRFGINLVQHGRYLQTASLKHAV
jgi:hypothetical protein